LVLIFLVLGTIFLGVATPTEGGAMGALGALVMAIARGKLSIRNMVTALDSTARLSCFVLFILIGSTIFSFTFNAADGPKWVEHLFEKMPGGILGFLLVVNVLVFILGCFIDFFEIAFIVVPILAPVAEKLGIDLVWFGVIIAMNLQTSFLTPPFGFALFYLRSVAAKKDYVDRVTKENIPAVTTTQIYKGAIAFIALQLIMVAIVIAYPGLVTSSMAKATNVDLNSISIEAVPQSKDEQKEDDVMKLFGNPPTGDKPASQSPAPSSAPASATDPFAPAPTPVPQSNDDPTKSLLEAMKQDTGKK
jgi:tripartite ATP-independent transporter DctM subunit